MELKETIAQEIIYNLSVLYKVLLISGLFMFFSSALLYLFNLNILPENKFISDSVLHTALITSGLSIIISMIFMYFRNIVRAKTRKFRTEQCRR